MYTEDDTLDELFRSRLANDSVTAPAFNWQSLDHEIGRKEMASNVNAAPKIARSAVILQWLSTIVLVLASMAALYSATAW